MGWRQRLTGDAAGGAATGWATQLRNAGQIDDIVLREVQAAMDIEEIRLRGPAPTD